MTDVVADIVKAFYRFTFAIFLDHEKEPENFFSYESFRVQNFRGLLDVSLGFSKNDLILLLGLNESGKTSILKAIETFDYNNDPPADELKQFFSSIRNKQVIEANEPCLITATIRVDAPLEYELFKKTLRAAGYSVNDVRFQVDDFLRALNGESRIQISRVIPFSSGKPGASYYRFEGLKPMTDQLLESLLAQEIVRRAPYIIYFEDFQDSIPDRIYTSTRSDAFNRSWYEIIDGLFYNTDPTYSIKKFESYYTPGDGREGDARSVLKRVNKTFKETFTKQWENLSGTQEIEEAEIDYNPSRKYFEINITEKDGINYSVHERSKGAIWYLAFLMKTEFRRKKLRDDTGKPIYLIDEPASNLHSTAQTKMVEDFEKLVSDTSLIYTTHSRYLISPSNVKNTYVVSRKDGVVRCVRWAEYIKGKGSHVTYYQPLHDCLNIVPTSFDIPWQKAIVTEGPADAYALEMMERVLEQPREHAIYPGSSASSLSTLISLNLGWGTKFSVLLDSDKEGVRQKKRYLEEFDLPDTSVVLLPGSRMKIEGMFTSEEQSALHSLALGEPNASVSKDEFLATLRAIMTKPDLLIPQAREILSKKTKNAFRDLFEKLKG